MSSRSLIGYAVAAAGATLAAEAAQHSSMGQSDELLARADEMSEFHIVDHHCAHLVAVYRENATQPLPMQGGRYYLAGVNQAQRDVYDDHCARCFAERSPHHYSPAASLAQRERLAGSPWRGRSVFEVSDAFVAFDGLVLQDAYRPPPNDGTAETASKLRPGRLFAFEAMPGFNGLGRLLQVLGQLGLASLAREADGGGHRVQLRPSDLTLKTYARRHAERVGRLPEERGIEHVHAFTYTRTFGATRQWGASRARSVRGSIDPYSRRSDDEPVSPSDSIAAAAPVPIIRAHCVLVMEQFWTVNYWHWLTDALPKALLLPELLQLYPGCRLLVYDMPWTRQYLRLLGIQEDALLVYDPASLIHSCTVLLPTPTALDAATQTTLRRLRSAVLPTAVIAVNALAMADMTTVGKPPPTVLLQVRGASAHGDGRSLTNLQELVDGLRIAVELRLVAARAAESEGAETNSQLRLVLFDHTDLSVAEQVVLHKSATLIIGVHGAGLANMLWMEPSSKVVEIIPIDVHLDFQCGLSPFWYVAQLLELEHHVFIPYSGRMFEPFELPIAEFFAFLRVVGVLRGANRTMP